MAVRHGYGKIEGTDALVFAYDTGDTVNSYKGEPTENIRAGAGLIGYTASGRTVDNSGTLTAPDGTTGWSSISSPGSNADHRIAQFAYSSLAEGSTYTFSLELYNPGPNSLEIFIDGNLGQAGTTIPLGYSRYSFTYTVTRLGGGTWAIFFGAEDKTINATYSPERLVYFKNYQVEEKSHATQFVNGTRSATEGLKDLTGNHTADLTNVSFDSNAQIDLDGTDDYIEIPDDASLRLTTDMSFEFIVYVDSSQSNLYPRLIDKTGYLVHLSQNAPFSIAHNVNTASGLRQVAVGSGFAANTWTHIVTTYDGQVGRVYVNSQLVANRSWESVVGATVNSDSVKVGGNGNTGRPLNGKLPIAKVYNRALTAAEVKNNYRHYKNRFGI